MILKNLRIVTLNEVIENGYIEIENDKIKSINKGECNDDKAIDCNNKISMPGFIDLHIHGSKGIDFMDAKASDYKIVCDSLITEGVTSFLATTLTSDQESLIKVAKEVKEAKKTNKTLLGIHLEGPYINAKYKGAQNEAFIRKANIDELKELEVESGNAVKYISLAPEIDGTIDFIKEATKMGVVCSAGHSDASFDDIKKAIEAGLTNTTHTHNAMSPHHHRNPGIVTAAMYFDELYTEVICDLIHVCPNTLKTFYKIVTSDRFMIITDSLQGKHSDKESFKLFGLDCVKKNGAAYLTTGPLAGSLLSMNVGLKNVKNVTNCSLIDLMKISSYNQSKCLHLEDRGLLETGRLADIVLLNDEFEVLDVYKEGVKVL